MLIAKQNNNNNGNNIRSPLPPPNKQKGNRGKKMEDEQTTAKDEIGNDGFDDNFHEHNNANDVTLSHDFGKICRCYV